MLISAFLTSFLPEIKNINVILLILNTNSSVNTKSNSLGLRNDKGIGSKKGSRDKN